MAKSDFMCSKCGVQSKSFISLSAWNKYKCPTCGTICSNCVKGGLITAKKCKHCKSKVLAYTWKNGEWERS